MSDYERANGKLKKVDLSLFENDIDNWARHLLRLYSWEQHTFLAEEGYDSLVEYIECECDDIMFLDEEPYEVIEKNRNIGGALEFSDIQKNEDGTLSFHCLWYNGFASLGEMIEFGMKNYKEKL
jgi:hypothetical protein